MMAPIMRRPMPGQANTVSVRMAPPMSWPTCMPKMVTMGIMEFRNPCITTTAQKDSPLARAVRTKSSFITSMSDERVMRAREATL